MLLSIVLIINCGCGCSGCAQSGCCPSSQNNAYADTDEQMPEVSVLSEVTGKTHSPHISIEVAQPENHKAYDVRGQQPEPYRLPRTFAWFKFAHRRAYSPWRIGGWIMTALEIVLIILIILFIGGIALLGIAVYRLIKGARGGFLPHKFGSVLVEKLF